ncbi:MAG: TetR/AcrR family transcriptional regulator [Acidimicrobiales bacterium]
MTKRAPARRGRPPKSDDPATKDRLLEAAAAACVADGFESVTLAGIADRVGVTATAIYNHFASREELLYAAGRRALDELAATLSPGNGTQVPVGPSAVHDIAKAYVRPEMAPTRRLFLELHLAGAHHRDLATHLEEWHREFAKVLADVVPADDNAPGATVKTLFMLLLGLCHLEDLGAIPADATAMLERVDRLVDTRYPVGSS